ncbi:MAG: Aspartate/glutamate/uridylate kinase [Piptocephalis tieghemiana]|nr:MAG: Aspartate/glutamate/uridylate kinase [Piptocephalis tieghemiana]
MHPSSPSSPSSSSSFSPSHPPSPTLSTASSFTGYEDLLGNPEGKPWLVLKFGGTAIGKFMTQITRTIIPELLKTHQVAIICSARSNAVKSQGTTSRLLAAASAVLTPGPGSPYNDILDALLEDHSRAAWEAIRRPGLRRKVEAAITEECRHLTKFLDAVHVIDQLSIRSKDAIVGTGERLASLILRASLEDAGVDAITIPMDDVVSDLPCSDLHSNSLSQSLEDQDLSSSSCPVVGEQLNEAYCSKLAQAMAKRIHVPVIGGFFGHLPQGLLSAVGRGYSDLTAALVAVGLEAKELQVWKEVEGIFTADPRKVPGAKLIPVITPAEAAELTYYGSEVIHPFTMAQVIRASIPIRIKHVEFPQGRGTLILPIEDFPSVAEAEGLTLQQLSHPRKPTAITTKDGVIVLTIHSNRRVGKHAFYARVFRTLDRHGMAVDMLATSEVDLSMVIGAPEHGDPRSLDRLYHDLSSHGEVKIERDMTIVSLVGRQQRHTVGTAATMFRVLAEAGVNIEIISQGANEIYIGCVVRGGDQALKALRAVHDQMILEPEDQVNALGK